MRKQTKPIKLPDFLRFEGQLNEQEKPNGRGKAYDKENNLIFYGFWRDGLPEGQGKLHNSKSVLIFEGSWYRGLAVGQGRQYADNGFLIYEGGFKEGYYSGRGRIYHSNYYLDHYPNALSYEGSFEKGKEHGYGISYHSAGFPLYEGEYKNGVRNGFGKQFYWPNATSGTRQVEFEGYFKEGFPRFVKEYSLNGKLVCEGEYHNLKDPSLHKDDRDWEDFRHDEGKEYDEDGNIINEGQFRHGKFIKAI